MSAATKELTPVAVVEEITSQAEPDAAVIEEPQEEGAAPGVDLEGLSEREQDEYERLVKGFREGLSICNATARQELLAELLKATESDPKLTRLWWTTAAMSEALKPIGRTNEDGRSPKAIRLALEMVMAEVRKALDPADELVGMKKELQRTVKGLDPKIRAIVVILGDLETLDGLSIDGLEFTEDLTADLRDENAIETAIEEAGDDADMTVLVRAYRLAGQIEEANDNN